MAEQRKSSNERATGAELELLLERKLAILRSEIADARAEARRLVDGMKDSTRGELKELGGAVSTARDEARQWDKESRNGLVVAFATLVTVVGTFVSFGVYKFAQEYLLEQISAQLNEDGARDVTQRLGELETTARHRFHSYERRTREHLDATRLAEARARRAAAAVEGLRIEVGTVSLASTGGNGPSASVEFDPPFSESPHVFLALAANNALPLEHASGSAWPVLEPPVIRSGGFSVASVEAIEQAVTVNWLALGNWGGLPDPAGEGDPTEPGGGGDPMDLGPGAGSGRGDSGVGSGGSSGVGAGGLGEPTRAGQGGDLPSLGGLFVDGGLDFVPGFEYLVKQGENGVWTVEVTKVEEEP